MFPEFEAIYSQCFTAEHCDHGQHVALSHVVSAADAAAGRKAFSYLATHVQGERNWTMVTAKLLVHFENPVLEGDWLEIRGRIHKVGTSSVGVYLEMTSFRRGLVVPIGRACSVMVMVDESTRKSRPHGLNSNGFEPIQLEGIRCATNGSEFDWSTARSIVQQITGKATANLNDDMFGGTVAGISQQTAMGLALRLYHEARKRRNERTFWTVRLAEINFVTPGQPGWFLDGQAALFEVPSPHGLVIGTRLQQTRGQTKQTVAMSRFVVCHVTETTNRDIGWKWALQPHGIH